MNLQGKCGRVQFDISLLIIAQSYSAIAQQPEQLLNKRTAGYHLGLVLRSIHGNS